MSSDSSNRGRRSRRRPPPSTPVGPQEEEGDKRAMTPEVLKLVCTRINELEHDLQMQKLRELCLQHNIAITEEDKRPPTTSLKTSKKSSQKLKVTSSAQTTTVGDASGNAPWNAFQNGGGGDSLSASRLQLVSALAANVAQQQHSRQPYDDERTNTDDYRIISLEDE